MALGRARGTGGRGGDEEKVMTSGPPQAGASWAGEAQFMVLLPACVLFSVSMSLFLKYVYWCPVLFFIIFDIYFMYLAVTGLTATCSIS